MDNFVPFEDLLGVPYKLQGRDKNGFDCYGLVIFYEKLLGNFLVDCKAEYPTINNEQYFNDNVSNILGCSKMKQTDNPRYGDIILFYDRKGRSNHISVYLYDGDYLHCDNLGVRVSNLKDESRRWSVFTWQK